MITFDSSVEIRKRTETIDAIMQLFTVMPPIKQGNIEYAVIGGFAVNAQTDDRREISDLDLVYSSKKDSVSIYRKIRRVMQGNSKFKKINVDVQSLSSSIYQALLLDESSFREIVRVVSYQGSNIPCIIPEAIAACKIYSSLVVNDELRDKDVRDIFLLNQHGFSKEVFSKVSEYAPIIQNASFRAIPFVIDKTLSLYDENPEVAKHILKNCRKISRILSGSGSKVTPFYSLVKDVTTYVHQISSNDVGNISLNDVHRQDIEKNTAVCKFISSYAKFI